MPSQSHPRYVIISPVRNEAEHLVSTIQSVASQTIPPQEWIIVDDGSTDGTSALLQSAAVHHRFIRVIERKDRGFRKSGTGVMEAFYEGFHSIQHQDWEFLVKLDGDMRFESSYFEQVFAAFTADAKLGIAGGEVTCFRSQDHLEIETPGDPRFHVRGANKTYRRQCWDEIGGLIRTTGWDTVDEVKANMLGWTTRRLSEVSVIHLKPTGAADGTWKNAVKNGRGSYISGYHPLFLVAKCGKRFLSSANPIEPLGLLYGYLQSCIQRLPRSLEPNLLAYMQKQQLRRLTYRSSIWQ